MSTSTRLGRWTAAAVVALGLGLLPAASMAQTATSQTFQYSATLSGANHLPPVTTSATGTFSATLSGDTFTYTLTVPSVTAATQAHIHAGAADESGGVALPLFAADGSVGSVNVSNTFNLSDLVGPYAGDATGFKAALNNSTLYVNVHTEGNPAGEIRGQIQQITTVAVGGNVPLGNFFVGANGMTLYAFDRDEPNKSNCYGGCADAWPALLVAAGEDPSGAPGVTGVLGVATRTDGSRQVTYNGAPLYFYANDSQPGDATGHGLFNVWFVATQSSAAQAAPAPAAPAAPPSTGNAGLSAAQVSASAATVALLMAAAVALVLGGRMLTAEPLTGARRTR